MCADSNGHQFQRIAIWGLSFMVILMFAMGIGAAPAPDFPSQVFAPYVDSSNWPPPDFTNLYAQTGVKYFTMAFVVAATDDSGDPTWGGYPTYTNGYLLDRVRALQALGGDVIISFGGEAGTPLAEVHTNVNELQAIYQSVVDMYAVQWIDFDIEGGHMHELAANDRRNKAIAALQVANPDLKITYTLPSQPDVGLNSAGTNLLMNAITNNVRVDSVNAMTMYFFMYPTQSMAEKTIAVATNLALILKSMYPAKSDPEIQSMIGLTPNIGFNSITEIFSLSDATQVLAYAEANKINELAMWSVRRDNNGCPGSTGYNADCSGIAQEEYEFSKLFVHFTTNAASGLYTITAVAGTNGTISPVGAVGVAAGSNQVFEVAASNLYRIATLLTNATPISHSFGNDDVVYSFTWSNVQANGSVSVTFADQCVTNTPVRVPKPWLHFYYPATIDYEEAALSDTDMDIMKAWQEYIAGTSPIDSGSVFTIAHCEHEANQTLFTVTTEPAHEYTVYFTDRLEQHITWQSFTNPLYGVWIETNALSTNHTFIDDYSTNTSGAGPSGGFRSYTVQVTNPEL